MVGVTARPTYRVVATREPGWWVLLAPDVEGREVASQCRRLDRAEETIREAIALMLDVPEDAFGVDLEDAPSNER